ncbi:heme exporter protein CcmD [Kangiella sp. TOML190]|uniref:heme exporter protein CcmD n=1 Tax=Kangiella sp. TOML190 TaxID=2931351 RepID=UPI0020400BEC|nr:heme exporter protein CcmD [Kangiella sp. TOML190]
MNWQAFFAMGKHGFYVWWSYGVTFLSIVLLFAGFAWYKKQLIKKVKTYRGEKVVKARKVTTEQISD